MVFDRLFRPRPSPLLRCTLELQAGQVFSHEAEGIGFFVFCRSGAIRLADAEGATRVLRFDESWGTTRRGRIAIEALTRTRLDLQIAPVAETHPTAATRPHRRALFATLALRGRRLR